MINRVLFGPKICSFMINQVLIINYGPEDKTKEESIKKQLDTKNEKNKLPKSSTDNKSHYD